MVVTYQQVAAAPDLFAHHISRRTFVVLDEVHHVADPARTACAARVEVELRRQVADDVGQAFEVDPPCSGSWGSRVRAAPGPGVRAS